MPNKYLQRDVRQHHSDLFLQAKRWLDRPTTWDPNWTGDWEAAAWFLNQHQDGRMFHEAPWTPKAVMGLFSQYRIDDQGNVFPTPRAPRQSRASKTTRLTKTLGFRRAATGYRRYLKPGTQQYRRVVASVVQAVTIAGDYAKAAKLLEDSGAPHLMNYRQGRAWTAPVVSGLLYRLKRTNMALYNHLVSEVPWGRVVVAAPGVVKQTAPKVLQTQEMFTTTTPPKQDFDFYAPPSITPARNRSTRVQIQEDGDLLQVFRTRNGRVVLTCKPGVQPGALMAAVDQFCQDLGVVIPRSV